MNKIYDLAFVCGYIHCARIRIATPPDSITGAIYCGELYSPVDDLWTQQTKYYTDKKDLIKYLVDDDPWVILL